MNRNSRAHTHTPTHTNKHVNGTPKSLTNTQNGTLMAYEKLQMLRIDVFIYVAAMVTAMVLYAQK